MRLAATVILVRPAPNAREIEVLLVRRSAQSAFAPDAFVFPGGTVTPADYERQASWPRERLSKEFRAIVPSALPSTERPVEERDATALIRAAVRETAEEVGIALDDDALHLFSHWITPPTEPRRYNTHFFVAAAANDHTAVADRVETHDERWIEPSRALALHRSGELHLVYPTIKHLERLAQFADVNTLLQFTCAKPILTIMPPVPPQDGFVMPSVLEGVW